MAVLAIKVAAAAVAPVDELNKGRVEDTEMQLSKLWLKGNFVSMETEWE